MSDGRDARYRIASAVQTSRQRGRVAENGAHCPMVKITASCVRQDVLQSIGLFQGRSAMRVLLAIIDRLLFAAGFALAMQLPQFVDSYTQRYGGYPQALEIGSASCRERVCAYV